MYVVYALITFIFWGIADLFYKIGNNDTNKYSHLKTGMFVGLIMGIHATIYLLSNNLTINLSELIKYLPVSLLYISSMIIGYKGLKYLEVSISSPIQNTSGVITSLLLVLFFKEKLSIYAYLAFILIFIGIILISYNEYKESKNKKLFIKNKVIFLTIIFPLLYCLLDGLGTFIDSIYLDKLSIISEDSALICYEYTFLIYSLITYIYLKLKKVKFEIKKEKTKIFAAIFETIGQYFYVFAMANDSTISASIVGSYCCLSFLLGSIVLHEKLKKIEYCGLSLAFIGIIILSILNI